MGDLSRRSFVKLSMGLFATLPAVAGTQGFLLPFGPRPAFASEGDSGQPQTHIVIVRLTEVGFVIMDMEGDRRTPVAGATVTITSRYNQRTATGTTDADGKLVLGIADLAEPSDTGAFACNASISIACPGMRNWRAQLVRLEGGMAYSFPTRALDAGVPYPALVTLNGWDVLYTQSDFCSSAANDATHTFRVELEGGAKAANVRLTSRDGKTTYALGTATSTANGDVASLEVTGYWLKRDAVGSFPPGGAFSLSYEVGNVTYAVDLNLTVTQNMDEVEKPASTHHESFSPFNALPGFSKITIPAGVPLIGGGEIVPALPQFPCNIVADPHGYFQISVGTTPNVYVNDSGSPDDTGWKTFPRDSIANYYKKLFNEVSEMSTKVADSLSKPGAVTQISYSRVFTAKASAQILAAARWDFDKHTIDGMLSAQEALAFTFSITENFWAGPFPLLVEFDLGLRMVLSIAAIAIHKDQEKGSGIFDWGSYRFDFSNSGTTFTIIFSPSLSVGIGVKAVASICMQGTFTVTLLMGITFPHFLVGLKAAASVVVQLLLFSASFDIWSWEMPKLYDSWDNGLLGQNNGLGNGKISLDDFTHIGQDNLAKVAEYSANTAATNLFANDAGNGLGQMDVAEKVDALLSAGLLGQDGASDLVSYERRASHPFVDPHANSNGANTLYQDLKVASERYVAYANANDLDPNQPTGLGGVAPSVDTVLVQNVLSDPRVQSYVIGGELYTFRLVSVLVDGEPRTRVVAEKSIDGKDEYYVIDSNTFIGPYASRKNLLDYDFAVSVPDPSKPQFAVLVFSSTVPFNPKPTVAEVASTVNYYTVFIMQGMGHAQTVYSDVFRDPSFKDWDNWFTYYLSNPWIEYVKHDINAANNSATDVNAAEENDAYWLSWTAGALVRRCDKYNPSIMLDSDTELNYALFYQAPSAKTRDPLSIKLLWDDDSDPDAYWPNPWSHTARNIYRADVIRHSQDACTLMLCDSDKTNYYLIGTPTDEPPGLMLECQPYDDRVHLTAWPGANHGNHGPMLCAYDVNEGKGEPDWRLRSATWSYDTLKFTDVGPTGFATSDFAVDASGNYLFFSSSREGSPGYTYDDADNPVDAPEVHEHRIMACRWRGDHFSDPFVFAQVDHPLGQMHVAGEVGSLVGAWDNEPAMCFVSTQINDAATGSADLWLTAVPEIACATVLDVESDMPLLSHGAPAEFFVTLRNDGNTFLSGCTLGIALVGHDVPGPDQWTRLDFSKETLRESAFNPLDADGNFEEVESDFALAPGKTSVYSVWLTLASDWEGELDVTVRSKDATVAPNQTKMAMSSVAGIGTQAAARVAFRASKVAAALGAANDERQPYQLDGRLPWDPTDTIRIQRNSTTDGSALADAPVRARRRGDGVGREGRASHATPADPTPRIIPTDPSSSASPTNPDTPVPTGSVETHTFSANPTTPTSSQATAAPGTGGTANTPAATADGSSPALPAGLALVGAGLLAYSRRRARLGTNPTVG